MCLQHGILQCGTHGPSDASADVIVIDQAALLLYIRRPPFKQKFWLY